LRSEDENAVHGTKKNVPALATLIANFDFEHQVPRGVSSAVGAVDVACIVQVHSAALHAFSLHFVFWCVTDLVISQLQHVAGSSIQKHVFVLH